MNRVAIYILTGLFCVAVATASAQSPVYTPDQIERVAKLSELYGHIKFFHPYPGYKAINWDSAFAATVPQVANAQTDEEAVSAIRQLLGVLNDEATIVQQTTKRAATATSPADSMQVYVTPDSILVLKTNGYAGVSDYERSIEKVGTLASLLPRARAVLLDLRSSRQLSDFESEGFLYAFQYVGLERLLSAEQFTTAGVRLRNYSGFAPESGNSSGGYWSGYYTLSGQTIQPRRTAKNRPLTILVNKNSVLTPSLFALRTRPHVRFYSTDTLSDAQLARTVTFPYSDAISVRFRTGELVNADGSIGLTGVSILPADNATGYAFDQLKNSPQKPAAAMVGTAAPLPVTPPSAGYPPGKFPALGYRLLAGAKIWSIIHYFHAYKDLMPTNWDTSLRTAIGELAAARDSMQYALAIAHFYRTIQDGHGFISGSALPAYAGNGGVLIDIQFIENKPVITRVYADSIAAKGIRVGDLVTAVNGEKIDARIARMSAVQPASNDWTRLYYVRNRLLRSPVGTPIRIGLLGADGREITISLISQPASQLQPPPDTSVTFRLLPGKIGYVDMGRLETKDVDRMFETFRDTKAIIFDTRNYPQGTAWAIAPA
ncbi:S41 family peptidase [Spirosoma luteum]|uniref:S41 family peptidase n=1 Tax=Spirosoma luteum TaxID=431553 RepID=UPI0003A73455|nr:PDZ domain-containing protein [Spirosoma luteum]